MELTKTEFALLEHLMRHPRQVLTRSQIFEAVWGYDFGPRSNSLEVYVGYLRRKTEEGGEPRLIQTVRGVGYSAARARVSLRRRLALLSALAVAFAVLLASASSTPSSATGCAARSTTTCATRPSRSPRGPVRRRP